MLGVTMWAVIHCMYSGLAYHGLDALANNHQDVRISRLNSVHLGYTQSLDLNATCFYRIFL